MTGNPRTIIAEVGRWCENQPWHPTHAPDYGVLEELGELMHAVLKNMQKIRGFEDEAFFTRHAVDALGDFMVYLSHWCYMHNCYFTFRAEEFIPDLEELRPTIGQVLIGLSRMYSYTDDVMDAPAVAGAIACQITHNMQAISMYLGINLENALVLTWDKVKQRDWNKDKMKGGE